MLNVCVCACIVHVCVPEVCGSVCLPGQLICGSGCCLDRSLECDGVKQCSDGLDEDLCSKCNTRTIVKPQKESQHIVTL